MVCDICLNVNLVEPNQTSDYNRIVSCVQCKISVHENCYGIPEVEDPWKCSFCRTCAEENERKCELCPKSGGPLKPTTNGKWVHVICSLFVAQVVIMDPAEMQPICLENIPQKSYRLKCSICNQFGLGVCIKCKQRKCNEVFHVSCAHDKKLLTEVHNTRVDSIDFNGYCAVHMVTTMPPRLSLENVHQELSRRLAQNLKVQAKKKNSGWSLNKVSNYSFIIQL